MFDIYIDPLYSLKSIEAGYILEKFPDGVFSYISKKGQGNRHAFQGAELRFLIKGEVSLTLDTLSTSDIIIYYGDFMDQHHQLSGKTTIELKRKFDEEDVNKLMPFNRFHPNLVRIIVKDSIIIKSIKGDFDKPKQHHMPAKKYLAYGTSITQGRVSLLPDLTYPQLLAYQLGYDVVNMGMSGTCYIEAALVDHMLTQTYDLITLELSVNMLGDGLGIDTFEERLAYLLEQINQKQPKATIIGISILENWRMYGFDQNRGDKSDVLAYRSVFEKAMRKYPKFIYVDGEKPLSKSGLSSDLIHPSHYGMIEISNYLYHLIKQL